MKYKRMPLVGRLRKDGATGVLSNSSKQGLLKLRVLKTRRRYY